MERGPPWFSFLSWSHLDSASSELRPPAPPSRETAARAVPPNIQIQGPVCSTASTLPRWPETSPSLPRRDSLQFQILISKCYRTPIPNPEDSFHLQRSSASASSGQARRRLKPWDRVLKLNTREKSQSITANSLSLYPITKSSGLLFTLDFSFPWVEHLRPHLHGLCGFLLFFSPLFTHPAIECLPCAWLRDMCVCVCAHTHSCSSHSCTLTHTHSRTPTHTQLTHMHTHAHICTHVHILTICTLVDMHTHTCALTHSLAHARVHAHSCTLTHAHTHSHTPVPESQLFNGDFFPGVALVKPALCSHRLRTRYSNLEVRRYGERCCR